MPQRRVKRRGFNLRSMWCKIILMKYLKFMLGVMVVVLPVLVYVFWPGDEERIRNNINASLAAAEAGNVNGIMEHVSLNYHDDHGISYLYLKRILEAEMERYRDIEVEVLSLKVRVIGIKAFASLEVRVKATDTRDGKSSRGYWLGDTDSPFFIEIEMKNEKPRGWKVYSGKYGTVNALENSPNIEGLLACFGPLTSNSLPGAAF